MKRRNYFLMLIAVFAGTSLWAAAQPPTDLTEQDRNRLVELRKQPEHLKKLRDNLKAFNDLAEARQSAIVKLDRELHELPVRKRERLLQTLERYADWLEQLRTREPKAYQAIKEAPNAPARLALIKERRDREWMEQQPKAHREQWAQKTGEARSEFVSKLRGDERHKREQWLIAKRFWKELEAGKSMPGRLSDFGEGKSDRVKKYVEEYLLPSLTAAEKKQLDDAEKLWPNSWPDYPVTLVKIASKYPSALPPKPPQRFTDLPLPVQQRLFEKKAGGGTKKSLLNEIKSYEGALFASKVVAIALREGKPPFAHEYLAASDRALSPPMQDFVKNKLMDAMKDQADKRRLIESLGKWPEYPEAIRDLSLKHGLSPPWHILPDEKLWKWELYRNSHSRSWGAEIAKDKK